ncbi:MAG: hypothetical protein RL095_379 [Verrucomicrobiota bacterium]|jgi:spore coat polysaccharide biosynthesis protein SpsF
MNILAILQARSSSSRLPRKVLLDIEGRPMILRQIERLRRSALIEKLVLATSDDPSDDELAATVAADGVPVHRGELDDVLARFAGAAAPFAPAHVVRLTGDCPLADAAVIDATLRLHLDSGADYTNNCETATFPDGLDCEVMRYSCLLEALGSASLKSQREHVTPWLRQNSSYRRECLKNEVDLGYLRWTVDEPRDLEFVRTIYARLFSKKPGFGMADILEILEKEPSLSSINGNILRNEGYLKSLQQDIRS